MNWIDSSKDNAILLEPKLKGINSVLIET